MTDQPIDAEALAAQVKVWLDGQANTGRTFCPCYDCISVMVGEILEGESVSPMKAGLAGALTMFFLNRDIHQRGGKVIVAMPDAMPASTSSVH